MPYLTLKEASARYDISEQELEQAIRKKKVKIDTVNDDQIILYQYDVAKLITDRKVDRKQFKHLEGNPISLSDASLKYQFYVSTLSDWARSGYLTKLGHDPYHSQKILIDEADIAYARARADLLGVNRANLIFK